MKKILSLLVITLTTLAHANNEPQQALMGFTVAGTNGGAFTTNLTSNYPEFQLAGTIGSSQTFAYETDMFSTGTTVSNVIFGFDFALTRGRYDTNTTVYATNSLNGTNVMYRLNSITAPAQARYVRHKSITMPANTNQVTIGSYFGQTQP